MARWIRFLIAVLVGVALGLLYGWVINPVEFSDTSPDTLRIDYKTDYALMVAEAYSREGDLALAAQRLGELGGASPEESVLQAIVFGEKYHYTSADLAMMRALLSALQAPSTGTQGMQP